MTACFLFCSSGMADEAKNTGNPPSQSPNIKGKTPNGALFEKERKIPETAYRIKISYQFKDDKDVLTGVVTSGDHLNISNYVNNPYGLVVSARVEVGDEVGGDKLKISKYHISIKYLQEKYHDAGWDSDSATIVELNQPVVLKEQLDGSLKGSMEIERIITTSVVKQMKRETGSPSNRSTATAGTAYQVTIAYQFKDFKDTASGIARKGFPFKIANTVNDGLKIDFQIDTGEEIDENLLRIDHGKIGTGSKWDSNATTTRIWRQASQLKTQK